MAQHENLWGLVEEALGEYLEAAGNCIGHRKADGGCHGYPAALLLLAATEAIGHILRHETCLIDGRHQKITRGEPFRVLNHASFGQTLSGAQIKNLEKAYRNPLAHNGMLSAGGALYKLPYKNGPAIFIEGDEVAIEVQSFHRLVADAWGHLDKAKIKTAVEGWIVPKGREN